MKNGFKSMYPSVLNDVNKIFFEKIVKFLKVFLRSGPKTLNP